MECKVKGMYGDNHRNRSTKALQIKYWYLSVSSRPSLLISTWDLASAQGTKSHDSGTRFPRNSYDFLFALFLGWPLQQA